MDKYKSQRAKLARNLSTIFGDYEVTRKFGYGIEIAHTYLIVRGDDDKIVLDSRDYNESDFDEVVMDVLLHELCSVVGVNLCYIMEDGYGDL